MDLQFARSRDYAAMREILDDPRVWRRATGGNLQPDVSESALNRCSFVLGRDADRVVGVFLLIPKGKDAEAHCAFSPLAWGRTWAIVRAFIAWVWANTELTRVLGPVPAYNRLARKMLQRAGWSEPAPGLFEIRKP